MRKVLPVVILFLIIAQHGAQAQRPIKVEQYTVLIERTVNRTYVNCLQYVSEWAANNPYACLNYPSPGCENNNGWQGMCLQDDDNCVYGNYDETHWNFHLGQSTYSIQGASINQIPKGTSIVLYDTLHLFQPMDGAYIETVLKEGYAMDPALYDYDCNFTTSPQQLTTPRFMNVAGDLFDQSFSTYSWVNRYEVVTRVRVIPNLDATYTLPSHDKIQMSTSLALFTRPRTWQYQDTLTNQWHDIPSNLYYGINGLKVSGYDLFGDNFKNYLNSTIKFRVIYTNGSVSDIVPFTLRLSSPHISSVTPTDLNCFERNEGSMKIQFDRQLLPGEKLNIFAGQFWHW